MKSLQNCILILTLCVLPFSGSTQNWLPVGSGFGWASGVNDFYVDTTTDLLYIAGRIGYSDTSLASPGIFAWNGSSYQAVGCGIEWNCQGTYNGPGPSVFRVTKYNGEIYVGGYFSSAGGKVCNNIARWNGTVWDSVGLGTNNTVSGMREINGELYVGGSFNLAGGIPVNGLAKWNGSVWSDVHGFPNYGTNAINDVIEYNGELYVCGNFSGANGCREIVKWDGTNWVDVGGGLYGANSFIERMYIFQNKLYVAGYFIKSEDINNPGNFIAVWDGTTWSDPAGGTFNPYAPLSNGQIHGMTEYHGELYIAGAFKYAGGVHAGDIAKWDGTTWCTFDTIDAFDARPYALAVYHDSLFVGGGFWHINGDTRLRIAKWGGGNYVDTCGQFYIGVDEPSAVSNLFVYPNPANAQITFQFGDTFKVREIVIYNQEGKEILRQVILGEQHLEIALNGVADGLYFYTVVDTAGIMASGKFLVLH